MLQEETLEMASLREKIAIDKVLHAISRTYRYFLGIIDSYVPGANVYVEIEKNGNSKETKIILRITVFPLRTEKVRSITTKGI